MNYLFINTKRPQGISHLFFASMAWVDCCTRHICRRHWTWTAPTSETATIMPQTLDSFQVCQPLIFCKSSLCKWRPKIITVLGKHFIHQDHRWRIYLIIREGKVLNFPWLFFFWTGVLRIERIVSTMTK